MVVIFKNLFFFSLSLPLSVKSIEPLCLDLDRLALTFAGGYPIRQPLCFPVEKTFVVTC